MKMHDPVPVLVTEKSLPESCKETLHGSFGNINAAYRLYVYKFIYKHKMCKTKSGNVNIIEDTPTLIDEDYDPENNFPTFYSQKCV